jgi:hypothetical protein
MAPDALPYSALPTTPWEEHVERCAIHAPKFDPLGFPLTPDRKWIAVSHIQKAIRRGRPEIANAWALQLWDADRSYCLFRMGVIAAEEIAGANPALARAFLSSEIKKTWFEERGGFGAFAYFVDQFAASPKDRTSCDLASTASLSHLAGVADKMGKLDFRALRAIAVDSDKPTPARATALWLLAGTKKSPRADLGDRSGSLMDFLGACGSICPEPDTLFNIDMSLRLNKEPNPLALALCRAAQNEATESPTLAVPTAAFGHGLPCAVDAHTREGRSAIEALLQESPEARALCAPLRDKADKAKLLGSLFFRLEGHETTPHLDYALASRTQAWHWSRLSKLSEFPAKELPALAQGMLPRLHELRQTHAAWAFADKPASRIAPSGP